MHNSIGDTVSLFSRSVSAVVIILCGLEVYRGGHEMPWWATVLSESGLRGAIRKVVEVMMKSSSCRVHSTLFQDIDTDVST